ncbi:BTAD domain-containing putative transcriptional regulator [Amycolatopsis taiwanensis]|uniref:BTAD domain-containing putative transcriptional regulator n=1 Tax=Amycolatopsis taiwanensis TaxID=342230 RepID=UPI0004BA50B1|nr:BTAD domain-containing putative transcriptional regulator [Amycolatopsis taiwanensis]
MVVQTSRFVGRVVRGLIAAMMLLALVAGLPWALWHYIGWPLPHHIPTLAEVQGVLLGPMTTTFVLDVLACLCWITWAAFTVDVGRCGMEVVRGARLPDLSTVGPVHTLAAVLVGGVMLSLLGNRSAPASAPVLSTALGTGSEVVATAPAWQHAQPHGEALAVRNVVLTTQWSGGSSTTGTAPVSVTSVVVRAPANGVHDSLWRIAERTLGDGARWPEIFELNKGKPQPGGHTLTQPSLIFPGEELLLPTTTATSPTQNPNPPAISPTPTSTAPPTSSPSTTSPPPASRAPSTPVPSTQAPATHPTPPALTGTGSEPSSPAREPGTRWGPELFVGLGLAAAVSAALVVARRRYRARYRPGSGDRDDLPVAPVVYQLRLAHLRADQDDEIDLEENTDQGGRGEHVPSPPLVVGASDPDSPPSCAPGLGVRDGREIALNLARARGLGLVGPGAPGAVRALLLATLTSTAAAGATVVVPAEDLAALLGHAATRTHLPTALRVVDNLQAALDALEAETLVRAAAHREQDTAPQVWPALVLVAQPPQQQHQRLQAILDNGAPFGVTGLLMGQWQPGITCYVRADGTISATGPGLGEALRGTHMFHLGDNHTAEVLTLLSQADPRSAIEEDTVISPVSRPRIVPAHTAVDQAPRQPNLFGTRHSDHTDAEPVPDSPLEVTAASHPPATSDTQLEILGSRRPPEPAPSQCPQAAAPQQPAASRTIVDEPETPNMHAPVAEPMSRSDCEAGALRVPVTITVLGALRVHWHPDPTTVEHEEREITGALQPRTQELLVLLALHPGGTTRDSLVSALWGDQPPARPTNALHTALSRLRRDFAAATGGAVTDITSVDNGHYQLDPAIVDVDYWRFAKAVTARRTATTEQQRIDAYRKVVTSYSGPLAEGMSKIEWIEPAREATRRDAIDAVAALARAMVEHDPQQTLDLLEIARAFDPHNEALYRDIMRLQERLGQLDAIPRTLALLTTRLAEINEAPSEHAITLATRLRQHHRTTTDTPARRPQPDATIPRRHAAS